MLEHDTTDTSFATDGGGVKGYSSLLILEELMTEIARHERSGDKLGPACTSSAWCPWTDCTEGFGPDEDFLMRHYVDYFVGTSTGGLVPN